MSPQEAIPDPKADTLRKLWEQSIPDPELWTKGDPTLTYKPRPSAAPRLAHMAAYFFSSRKAMAKRTNA